MEFRTSDAQSVSAFLFSFAHDLRKGLDVLIHGRGDGLVVNELAFAASINQAGVGESFQVVRHGGRCNSI